MRARLDSRKERDHPDKEDRQLIVDEVLSGLDRDFLTPDGKAVSQEVVKKHLERLKVLTIPVRRFADKQVAHLNEDLFESFRCGKK